MMAGGGVFGQWVPQIAGVDLASIPKPKPVDPVVQYVSEQVAQPETRSNAIDTINEAKKTGLTATDQARKQYSDAIERARLQRAEADKLAAEAAGYNSAEVDSIYSQMADLQTGLPQLPARTVAKDPTLAQRGLVALASLIKPRMALPMWNLPYQMNEADARAQDATNLQQFTQAEGRARNLLSGLNSRLNIAQRAETSRRAQLFGAAAKADSAAAGSEGLGLKYLSQVINVAKSDADRLSREGIAANRLTFDRNKETNRLQFDRVKLDALVKQRARELAETIRFHSGTLTQRDQALALARAKQEAADAMDQMEIQWHDEKSKKEAAVAAAKLRADAGAGIRQTRGTLYEISEKKAKVVAAMRLLNDQLEQAISANGKPEDIAKLQSAIAAQSQMFRVYNGQEMELKAEMAQMQADPMDDPNPDTTDTFVDPAGANWAMNQNPQLDGRVQFFGQQNEGANAGGATGPARGAPLRPGAIGPQQPGVAGAQGPQKPPAGPVPKTLPPVQTKASKGQFNVGTRGGSAQIRVIK
jgi:hypothetical protein